MLLPSDRYVKSAMMNKAPLPLHSRYNQKNTHQALRSAIKREQGLRTPNRAILGTDTKETQPAPSAPPPSPPQACRFPTYLFGPPTTSTPKPHRLRQPIEAFLVRLAPLTPSYSSSVRHSARGKVPSAVLAPKANVQWYVMQIQHFLRLIYSVRIVVGVHRPGMGFLQL